MIARPLLPLLLAALIAPTGARAEGAPFAARQACASLERRHVEARKPLDARTLNFLLFDAAGRGCDAMVSLLLENGADPARRDRRGESAADLAADAATRRAPAAAAD